MEKIETFNPRHDDIYIATYPRSGTTWMQMILYQLTTNGEMTFNHIYDVIPFWDVSVRNSRSLEHLPSPRIFKTHLPYRIISRYEGRYIYLMRDGKDVLVSHYYFYRRYTNPDETFPEFFDKFISGRLKYGSWFKHVNEWRANSNNPDVLLLRYEELHKSLKECLIKISKFCRLSDYEIDYSVIAERCKFEFMKKYEEKFAPECAPDLQAPEDMGHISYDLNNPFLRSGIAGNWRELLTKEQELAFDKVAETMFQ